MSAAGSCGPGPVRFVFSDVDETLIACKSLLDFLDFFFRERYGAAGAAHAAAVRRRLADLVADGASRAVANRAYYEAWTGEPAAEVAASGRRWYQERRAAGGFYLPEPLAEVRAHQAVGAGLVLVSGSFGAVLEPIAVELGAVEVLCTRPEEHDGVLTGAVVGEPCIGEGKRRAVRALLARHPQIRPADCYGYGDHVSDLPMLAEVGHPVVVGGDPEVLALLPGARAITGCDAPSALTGGQQVC